jgi:hypothetical protein
MTIRPWVKWALFGNSYTPFFLILLFRDLKTAGGWHWPLFRSPGLSWTLVGVVLVSNIVLLAVLILSGQSAGRQVGEIESISSKASDSLQYILTYIIPFLSFQPSTDLVPLIILLVVIGVLYVSSNLLYVNPMLSLFGYGVYDVTLKIHGERQSRIILTRRHHGIGDAISFDLLTGGCDTAGKTVAPGSDAIYREVFS